MTYIKLTDKYGITMGGMRWEVGITNRATGEGNELCTDGVLHVYDTPEQAAFMQPAHCLDYTRAWEVKSRCKGLTDGTKRGIKSCTVVREIELPELTAEQRAEIAVRVSLLIYDDPEYVSWAKRWVSGEDRSAVQASQAIYGAHEAQAAHVSYAAYAAADTAAQAAYADRTASYAAHVAAHAATVESGSIDLISIIEEVLG